MPESLEDCIRVVKSVITPEMNSDLVKQISNEEVEKAIFTMNGRLDLQTSMDFPAIFYRGTLGETIGPSVCTVVREAFCSGSWPQDFNATLIALIPKVKTPSKVSEFRPISLCNALIKFRQRSCQAVQKILPQIISPSQSAFIPDRLITDNAIVAFEVMHTMNTGFRDFELFNLAMLAKQGWRLLHYPNSLAARVLSAKYYHDGNFLEAKVKRSSSFIWRSVMAARSVLESGLMWRIGDGSKVRIWQDKWLPSASSFKIQSQCLDMDPKAKVATLIDPNQKEEDVLHALLGLRGAKIFGQDVPLIFQKDEQQFHPTSELVMVLLSKLEEKYLAEFGVVVSKIWQRRNEFIFKHYLSTPSSPHSPSNLKNLDILNSLTQSKTSPKAHPLNSDPSSPRWQPPPEGVFKVNWDAEIGINQIILEGDALQVVNDLLRDEENWGQAGLISMDTKVLSRNFITFLIHHVKRASNVIAHTLAKNTLTMDDVLVELEEVPNCIGSLVDPFE
ncbi:hypothetical protein Pint_20054 [Pistacia integerrima]|uniref:Uncharacterized protein n=1 Tax=Pistacia integerrima TaxID=434235 RepID=A0ACC0X925_9ROSI|nr:hypothetical protein Pint_20054 [Pistacia integerrima]